MATITIAGDQIPNYHEVGTLHELRVFSDRSWKASDDTTVPGRGNNDTYYASYTLSVVGTVATIPSVTLKSNQDALNNVGKIAKYTAQVYVDGAPRDVFMPNVLGAFTVPSTPTSTTWGALETYNSIRRDIPASGHPTTSQVQNLIDIAVGTLNDAAVGVKGRTALSVNPIVAGSPIAVSDNDLRVNAVTNVLANGATGDGTTDDTAALQAIIDAATAFDTIYFPPQLLDGTAVNFRISAALTIDKALTLLGSKSLITQVTANTAGIVITASNVIVDGLRFAGPQDAINRDGERAIDAHGIFNAGTSPTYIANITIKNCTCAFWGGYGIIAQFVNSVNFHANHIQDIKYAGIEVLSCVGGTISNNNIDGIGFVGGTVGVTNAYGIAVSRNTNDAGELTSNPRSTDIIVSNNVVRNIPTWEAYDTHAGQRIQFDSNDAYNCYVGITIGPSNNNSAVSTYAPLECTVTGGTLDSAAVDATGAPTGLAGPGINFNGALGVVAGTPTQKATGSIVGVVIKNYGRQNNGNTGAINLVATQSVVILGNEIINPSPFGVLLFQDNYNALVVGNTITDAWSGYTGAVPEAGVGQAVCVILFQEFNTSFVGGNIFASDPDTPVLATDLMTYGVRVTNQISNGLSLAQNRSNATTYLQDDSGGVAITGTTLINPSIGVTGTTITAHYSGTKAWDVGNLADGATATTTVTVTSAVVGNTTAVGLSSITAVGWQISAQVISADTVGVTLTNHTGGAVDLPSGTLRCDVWQH